MKKALLILGLLFFVNSVCSAQVAGNQISVNQGSTNNSRKPETNTGNLIGSGSRYYSIESSVLINLKQIHGLSKIFLL